MINYDNKTFGMVTTSTGASGNVLFYYRQTGDVVWGTFDGDGLMMGVFVATANTRDVLDLRYAFVVSDDDIRTGVSRSTPEMLADGRIRLHEDFYFTSGDQKKGLSVVEELSAPDIGLSAQSKTQNRQSPDIPVLFLGTGSGIGDKITYEGLRFASVANAPNGEVTGDTIFEYRQRGDVAWAEYAGGAIRKGMLVAVVAADGALDMRYLHVNAKGELMTGECRSTPEVLADGRIRLHETWRWTSGDQSTGTSVVEEIR
jgi:hypothetical protein